MSKTPADVGAPVHCTDPDRPAWTRTSVHDPMPVREPLRFPHLSHAGGDRWHTLCKLTSCSALIEGTKTGPGSAISAEAAHTTAVHNRYAMGADPLVHLGPRLMRASEAHHHLPTGRYPTILADRRYVVLWVEPDRTILAWPEESRTSLLRP